MYVRNYKNLTYVSFVLPDRRPDAFIADHGIPRSQVA